MLGCGMPLTDIHCLPQIAIVDYELGPNGWSFDKRTKEATGDPVYGKQYLREI
jgi:glutathionyl-hydroquinone reductase